MSVYLERPLILGIESSCDDTGCAVVDGTGRVLASEISSQVEEHHPFGGVVPEIASREHLSNWPAVSRGALAEAGIEMWDVDAVAATRGPGLVGCLLVGLSLGRAIAHGLGRPFHGIHHLEGHIYSPFLSPRGEPAEDVPERFNALVVSGGHTSLFEVERGRVFTLIETRDDALGEVFDKVGKRLGLPYPQGPKVDALAERGEASKVMFRVPTVKDELYFSYSGLKSQALREIEALERRGVLEEGEAIPWGSKESEDEIPQPVLDLLASFRYCAVRQLIDRLRRHQDRRKIHTLAVSGGAAANRLLRRELIRWAEEGRVNLRLVPMVYAADNAAMIAFAALVRQRYGKAEPAGAVKVASRIPFE